MPIFGHASTGQEPRKDGRIVPAQSSPHAKVIEGREVVTVVPVTHSPPADPADAVEIPSALKVHLGLDDLRSWIVVTETNDFLWPGPDLRPIPGSQPKRFDYGFLPPRFFAHVRQRLLDAYRRRALTRVPRSE